MTKKLSLQIEDLEDRIAPSIILPNGNEIFAGDLLQGELHPALTARDATAVEATFGNGPFLCVSFDGGETVIQLSNTGPWSSHVVSPVLENGGDIEVDCPGG